ncbi:ubiquitin-conjugating enzyme E2-binding protein [Aspergillus welwitschiae]|uniref:Ubiquitin-conjugating enzyme E2-binding protein n=1 Tax=Aspergillus welwitschiae TaxID=1341132 RepID=A0A3F3PN42_9EURO|nr:ubiquitin-conjugating enzyme E2-binding protein [Aspergillus welwitschiae]RDH27766.1 ubiquitin-conjugating enzyme E2-binding protein [Aspergillus welwitschiae]
MSQSLQDESQTNPATPLHLHAELLPNIRQLTLYISVPPNTPRSNLQITLSDSRRAVTVTSSLSNTNQDDPTPTSETIKLPARVSESSRRILQQQPPSTQGESEYSFRMQVDDNDTSLHKDETTLNDGFIPWTATDMSAHTRLRCVKCHNPIMEGGKVWKDLPSGNWAEMMDFWHCHKPDPPEEERNKEGEDPNAVVKGYGAGNQLVAVEGTVLVDVTSFLVKGVDCLGVEESKVPPKDSTSTQPDTDTEPTILTCTTCTTQLGLPDPIANGYRLFKTSLSANTTSSSEDNDPPEETWESHPPETILTAQLLELIERESYRRFVIHCGAKAGLLIWPFNPSLRYSTTSASHSTAAQLAMKVFYQHVDNVEEILHPEVGKGNQSLAIEEVRLPGEQAYRELVEVLEARNAMLPASARVFREWRVGLLWRFERK